MADASQIENETTNSHVEVATAETQPATTSNGGAPADEAYDSDDSDDKPEVPSGVVSILKLIRSKSQMIITEHLPVQLSYLVKFQGLDYKAMCNGNVMIKVLSRFPEIADETRQSYEDDEELRDFIINHLFNLCLKYIDYKVLQQLRDVAQSVLFYFISKEYVSQKQVEENAWPIIQRMVLDVKTILDLHADGIMLMCKLGQYFGVETTERLLIPTFINLCNHEQSYVRQVCLPYFSEFFSITTRETFENVLFPKYLELCEDKNFGVRKKCAKLVMSVSCVCNEDERREKLAPAFVKFLEDKNRWVRMAAFHLLGPFISTFAKPMITVVNYNNTGDLVIVDPNENEFCLTSPVVSPNDKSIHQFHGRINPFFDDDGVSGTYFEMGSLPDRDDDNDDDELRLRKELFWREGIDYFSDSNIDEAADNNHQSFEIEKNSNNYSKEIRYTIVEKRITELLGDCDNNNRETNAADQKDDLEQYNSYNYWRISPDTPLDPEIVGETSLKKVTNLETTMNNFEALLPKINFDQSSGDTASEHDDSLNGNECTAATLELPLDFCDHVPYILIHHFVSMVDKKLVEETDRDLAYHCAYSLPAVAMTLGAKNWHLIGHLLDKLTSDLKYKVRRTVANSLHVLASILGPEITSQDLTPIFYEFIKDLDEVRIGIVRNLTKFLQIIDSTQRSVCLAKLIDFLRTDNQRNWRLRQEFASQLVLAVNLFTPQDIGLHMSNISLALLCDKVAAVRQEGIVLIAEMLKNISGKRVLVQRLMVKLAERLAHSKKWQLRQTYASMCAQILIVEAITEEQFATEAMPHLLDLSWDPVANVRLVVARTIARNILKCEYFWDANNQHYYNLKAVLRRLQSDKDSDVRMYMVEAPFSS